jgi:Neuraminidase (sialidase)
VQVKELILATDMSRHHDYFTRFEEFCKNAKSDWAGTANTSETEGDRYHNWIEAKIPSVTEQERTLLLVMVVKCADVANVVKPLAQSEDWAMRILNEFYAQVRSTVKSIPSTSGNVPSTEVNIPPTSGNVRAYKSIFVHIHILHYERICVTGV